MYSVYVIGPSSTLGRTNREPGKNTARAEGPDGVSLSHSGGRFRLEFIGVRGRAFRAWENPGQLLVGTGYDKERGQREWESSSRREVIY